MADVHFQQVCKTYPSRAGGEQQRPVPVLQNLELHIKDGVVTVNFTKEFAQIAQESDGGRQALRAILFTCSQFPGVKKASFWSKGLLVVMRSVSRNVLLSTLF